MNLSSWRSYRCLALLGFVLLSGCATPDLHPFATETASLGSAISAERAEVQGHFAKVVARAETRDPSDTRVKQLKEQQDKYANNAAAIDAVLSVAVDYSNTLVDLAAQGETGGQAVDSLAKSLQGLKSAVDIALPAAGTIPEWTANLIREVGTDVTRIQAQKSLAAALKEADPAVDKIAKAISEAFAPKGAVAVIATGLQAAEAGVLRDEVGKNRLAFYRGVNVATVKMDNRNPQTRLEYFFGDINDRIGQQNPAAGICGLTRPIAATSADPGAGRDDPQCLTGQTAQGLVAITSLLAGIEPQFQAYSKDLAASKLWLQQRESVDAPIAAAALAWAADHHAITNKLATCGGLRALRASCGNLTFANLKLFVGRVKAITAKGANDVGQ